ncbi:Rrf2 family transcriptional regulator [Persicobacter psychrovividus]|uniref:Rrf2 family transcriptional regulator n=1 Tax=Persicobacter psychrovividus TaxID=387638 RepID=A0ABN6L4R7_9BACT|nr:hypothetical protein PEPS_03850 [Persicobacter psychrovividus]
MFSKACSYGIRAMIYISAKTNQGIRLGIKDIAKEIESPEAFTGKILQTLSKKGLVDSVKGPKGGFSMTTEQQQVSLFDIVSNIDGDELMTGCGLGFKKCSEAHPCPMHHQYKEVRAQFNTMLRETQLKTLSDDFEQGLSFFHPEEG